MSEHNRLLRHRRGLRWCALGGTTALAILGAFAGMPSASAAQPPVGLGTATSFAVLAGTTITNTGASTISGDIGVSPGAAITQFPPGKVINGTQHAADAVALQAQKDLTTGYNSAASRTPASAVPVDLGGKTLTAGVYKASSALGLTGTVTLNAAGDPNAVFVFQAPSTLITASSSNVALTGGAQACNVFWQVGSSATLGTNSTFVGTVMALTSATVQTGATVAGRVLARNGQVSLDDNTITRPICTQNITTSSVASGATATSTSNSTANATSTAGGTPGSSTSASAAGAGTSGGGTLGASGGGGGSGSGAAGSRGSGGSGGSGGGGGGTPTDVPAGSGGLAATHDAGGMDGAAVIGFAGLSLMVVGAFGMSRRRSR